MAEAISQGESSQRQCGNCRYWLGAYQPAAGFLSRGLPVLQRGNSSRGWCTRNPGPHRIVGKFAENKSGLVTMAESSCSLHIFGPALVD
jgi:hypothetical protein